MAAGREDNLLGAPCSLLHIADPTHKTLNHVSKPEAQCPRLPGSLFHVSSVQADSKGSVSYISELSNRVRLLKFIYSFIDLRQGLFLYAALAVLELS